nr:ribonuclease H-like domain-containing protein [Tanacetum cinerariifolium]
MGPYEFESLFSLVRGCELLELGLVKESSEETKPNVEKVFPIHLRNDALVFCSSLDDAYLLDELVNWYCNIGKNKIGFIDGSYKGYNTDEVLGKQWDMYDAMVELPKCVCNASDGFKKHNQLLKLMQFLMGLDDSYMQITSSILSREVLPDVRSAYAIVSSKESHKVAVGSVAGSSQRNQASAFVSNVPNSQNFQRSLFWPKSHESAVCGAWYKSVPTSSF